jgi:hypothetical protein
VIYTLNYLKIRFLKSELEARRGGATCIGLDPCQILFAKLLGFMRRAHSLHQTLTFRIAAKKGNTTKHHSRPTIDLHSHYLLLHHPSPKTKPPPVTNLYPCS